MSDDVTVAISMIVPAAVYERLKAIFKKGRKAGSEP